MLDHYQPEDAAHFCGSLEADPDYVAAYLGMARVAAQRYDKKALDFAQQALQHDPSYIRRTNCWPIWRSKIATPSSPRRKRKKR